jgi:cytoskeletal protein RodZ
MSETVGQLLRATREAKGQTLEDVERVTRIRAKHLAAIEADQFAALPSTAHARGFLKNYAEHLGLDTATLLTAYEAQVHKRSLLSLRPAPPRKEPIVQGPVRPKVPPLKAAQAARAPGRSPQVRLRRRPRLLSADVVFAAVIMVLMVALLFWGGTQLATTLASAATPTVSLLAGLNTPDPAAATAAALATATERPAATPTPLPPTPAGAFSGVNVTVVAELRTWVSVKVDGEEVYAGLLPPGEQRDFTGLTQVEIATGNGRGTRIIFNGVDQGLMGDLGEVAIRLWTEGGMLFPTPTMTATPEG